jgi:hypothetical protein
MFERFTDRARRVLVLAQEEARALNHGFIGTEHILLGLIHEGEGLAAKALESLGISLEAVRTKVEDAVGPAGPSPTGNPPFTPRAKKVLELSLREALQLGHNYIGTEHMLLGLVREGEGVAAQVLRDLGADLVTVRQTVVKLLSGSAGENPQEVGRLRSRARPSARHPRRVLEGPDEELSADGVRLRVIGVSQYVDGTDVFWRLSGLPQPLADLFVVGPHTTPAPPVPTAGEFQARSDYVQLSDEQGTRYANVSVVIEFQEDGSVSGLSTFAPPIKESVKTLIFGWQRQDLRFDV